MHVDVHLITTLGDLDLHQKMTWQNCLFLNEGLREFENSLELSLFQLVEDVPYDDLSATLIFLVFQSIDFGVCMFCGNCAEYSLTNLHEGYEFFTHNCWELNHNQIALGWLPILAIGDYIIQSKQL